MGHFCPEGVENRHPLVSTALKVGNIETFLVLKIRIYILQLIENTSFVF